MPVLVPMLVPGASASVECRCQDSCAVLPTDPVPLSPPDPARYFDIKTTEPISFFLSGLEELLAWKPDGNDDFNISTVPLAKRQPPLHSKRPRTLVCHDMRGGYIDDRYALGRGEMRQRGSTSLTPNLFCLVCFLLAWLLAGKDGRV